MDPGEPHSSIYLDLLLPWNFNVLIGIFIMLILLLLSALISGSEVAYYSLSPQDKKTLEEDTSKSSQRVLELFKKPKTLLATILIGNNLVNVAIIILSSLLMKMLFNFEGSELLGFIIQVVAVTLIILMVGEISPKVYATKNAMRLALIMGSALTFMSKLFYPLARVLVVGTRKIDQRAKEQNDSGNFITADELNHALELTTDNTTGADEKRILSGIVKFGSTEVRQVMTPRIDVICFDTKTTYKQLQTEIVEHGFSRIPIFEDSFDNVVGILYVKDLLNHLHAPDDFDWKPLLRNPSFVTENKKLDDLLREFQDDKNHMAVVVDEYGGSSGVISLEDIIEEIVGEISDEFDDEELIYTKIDENNYVFEGKAALIDVYRVLDITGEKFEAAKGDSDSLAGFILELTGKIPQKNERIRFEHYLFTIEAADKRRVKRVKVTIQEESK
ncbi:gliding motility-associated protein GldE [bacterium]|nr:gliding motility-associated protein GldE [Salibacteraceae bacterium]MDC1220334.1 gliding motility-associated protein GldE [bacterium]MDC1304632.1 gliding motility-associated protein GldE [Salibacteraceae bacterium]